MLSMRKGVSEQLPLFPIDDTDSIEDLWKLFDSEGGPSVHTAMLRMKYIPDFLYYINGIEDKFIHPNISALEDVETIYNYYLGDINWYKDGYMFCAHSLISNPDVRPIIISIKSIKLLPDMSVGKNGVWANNTLAKLQYLVPATTVRKIVPMLDPWHILIEFPWGFYYVIYAYNFKDYVWG